MTPDQALRQSILQDNPSTRTPRTKWARKPKARARPGFGATLLKGLVIKVLLLTVSLGATRYVLGTEEGQAFYLKTQEAIARVVVAELAARAEAGAAPRQPEVRASGDEPPAAAPGAKRIRLQAQDTAGADESTVIIRRGTD
ncbi:hypothetical protein [Primorskyibacter sp. S187A]|uniref:hypothetical protein n=1 Tax=Primorskyibacter sp. S187A TaxID=3415130 RepID=UPI003C7A5BDB